MIRATLVERGTDGWGSGAFMAPRGGHKTHRGVDYVCFPGTGISTHVSGLVTKIGLPYANEHFRYVQVTDSDGFEHRFFYVYPMVIKGDHVRKGRILGTAQNIAGKYNEVDRQMDNHIHYEVKRDGEYFNPDAFLHEM